MKVRQEQTKFMDSLDLFTIKYSQFVAWINTGGSIDNEKMSEASQNCAFTADVCLFRLSSKLLKI